ncbi:MAG: hypothetical protein O7C39_05745 [Bacteroidetes bacterium]|nr:hypothetical protein [Bacteroidota bacterium]
MKFHELDSHQSLDGLRALAMIGNSADSGLDQPQRALLDAIQHCLLHTDIALENLASITADELSARFQGSTESRQLIQQMILVSLADGPPNEAQSDLILDFAQALRVNEPAVKVTRHLMQGKRLRFRLGFYPRSNVRDYIAMQYRTQGGVLGVIKGLMGFRGLIENRKLADRFRALENLPKNTFGYQFFIHCRNNGLNFPGEKGGFPVGAVWHDFGHVLAGYDTSPEGEIQAASFQAGNRQNDNAFFTMLFGILIHTSGVNMAPIDMPVLKGRIGNGNLAEKMFNAWLKGTRTTVDLGADWDFWSYLNLPLDVARERIGVSDSALA